MLWKTALYALVLILALVHALVLGPRIRRLSELDPNRASGALARLRALSAISQVLMLVGTLAILALAAELVT